MDYKYVIENWLYYGISDLFFAHHLGDHDPFASHRAFYGITSVEKHLKALLLYLRRAKYEHLPDEGENSEGRQKVNKIAKKCGHNFTKMVEQIQRNEPNCGISDLINDDYGLPVLEFRLNECGEEDDIHYTGNNLLSIFQDAYEETRYPTDRSVFNNFPIGNSGYYFDPLSSAGFHQFTHALCQFVINRLNGEVDVGNVLRDVTRQHQGLDSFQGFRNLFLEHQWPDL